MAGESRYGRMALIMRASGGMAYFRGKACLTIPMETSIQGAFIKTEQMGLELIFTKMVKYMKGSGKMICIMGREKKNSQMALRMRAYLMKERGEVMAYTPTLKMALFTRATGTII